MRVSSADTGTLRIYAIREHKDTTQSILRLQEMIQHYEPSYQFPRLQEQLTLPELVEKWKEAKKALKECQNQARELQYKRYEDLLIYYEVDSSPDSRRRANIVKSTLRTERCRTYRSIRLSTKPFSEHTGGLKSILIPHITRNTNPNMEATGSVAIYSWLSQNPGGHRNGIASYCIRN
jgi:hypothetical protein